MSSKKILLLNDTSDYHSGCEKVIESFTFDYSIKTDSRIDIDFKQFDLVILNGEGTMHSSRTNSVRFLRALRDAQNNGCETHLVNSVWQNMTNDFDDVLQKCDIIEVREILSKNELKDKHDIDSEIKWDRSLNIDVPYEKRKYEEVYQGSWFFERSDVKPINGNIRYPRINIFKQKWNDIVNRLRNSKLLITGRHHEACAAIKARCKFIVLSGNTHKNEGLFLNVGVQPKNKISMIEDILNGKYDDDYEKINEYYKC
tara:strand:+ start:642 stop:1412 length:771 start_codon:yes stop_codon:yes gene_type:complete